MKKTIFRMINFAALAAIICFGCGGDDGGQTKSLSVSDLLNAITGGGTPTHDVYTLTVNVLPTDGGTVSRRPNANSYEAGTRVSVTAEAKDGYRFTGWSGDVNDTAAVVTVTMNNNLTLTAVFVPIDVPTYILSVKSEPSAGGNVSREPNRTVYNTGEQVTVKAAALAGYTFTGWSGDANGADAEVTVTMNRDLTVTANFRQNTYSLFVGANPASGGTVSRDPQEAAYTYGERVTVTAAPASGYSFTGWSGDTIGTANSVTITIDGNKTLTATFQQNRYTLTTNVLPSSDYGSVLRNPNKETYTYGEQVTVTAAEAPKSGDNYYAFNGWTGASESKSAGVTITMDGNKTLTANFTRGTVPYYTLSTVTTPYVGEISRNPNNASYREGATVTVTAPTVAGYTFTGWSGASTSTTAIVTVTMDGDKTLTAIYKQNDYKLTVEIYPANSGSVSRNPNNNVYTYNQSVAITATPANGYRFTGWSGDMSGTANPATIAMNSDKTVRANFEWRPYTLEIRKNINGGEVTSSPNKNVYTYGESVTVTARKADGYTFTGWSGASTSKEDSVTIIMNDDKTLTANFQQDQYTLATNISPVGGGTVSRSPTSTNQTTYTYGAAVTVTAAAADGYTFAGWSGASTSTEKTVTITMDGNKTLTANFKQKFTLPIKIPQSGSGSVSLNPSKDTYESGEQVTLTATAANCYTFTGWSGASTSASASVTVTMPLNDTLIANFKQIEYTLTINPGGGSVSRSPNKEKYLCGDQVTVTLTTPPSCYTFTGWSGASTSANASVTIIMDGNKTLTPIFQQIQYTLTTPVSPSGGGSVSRSPNKDTYLCGEQVTVTAAPASCYTFTGWSGASTSTNASVTITMDGNKTLTANFQQSQYTLTTNVSPSSSYGSVSRSTASYACGTSVTVTATPVSDYYAFTGWSGASTSTSASVTVTMDGTKTLTANFRAKVQKRDSVWFSAPGSVSYKYDKGFSATAEVYVYGAGGGGAGGSTNSHVTYTVDVVGGSGGGGGATSRTISIINGELFSVTVGKRGEGGARKDSPKPSLSNPLALGWNYGDDGTPGGPSHVTVAGNTIAAGGGGNGIGGPSSSGAPGGSGGSGDVSGSAGLSGGDCGLAAPPQTCSVSVDGGGAGAVLRGRSAGKGGKGGINTAGANGENGYVKIIFTWYE